MRIPRLLIALLTVQLIWAGPMYAQSAVPPEEAAPAATSSPAAAPPPPATASSFADAHTVLDAQAVEAMSHVTVGAGQTLVIDFSGHDSLTLTGNITNNGTILAVSSNQAIGTANISANNLVNGQNAVLTTVLPTGGVAGLNGLLSNLSLSLFAAQDIINSGVIASAGNLNLTAGGTIMNALPAGVTGVQPVMQAAQNLSLISGAGSIVNSGLIQSMAGNININTLVPTNLMVNNAGGRMEALLGSINVRDALFSANKNLDLIGGDYVSQTLDLFSGEGIANAAVNDISGLVNVKAGQAHMLVSSGALQLGELCLTGDPTFFNNAVNGDVNIAGNITVGEALTIIASRNITASTNATLMANNGTRGFDITLIAGADMTTTATTANGSVGPFPSIGTAADQVVTVNGASGTGGSILLNSASVNIYSKGITGSGQGGNVTLAAYENGGSGGQILLSPTSTIDTRGAGSGASGNVTIIAGQNANASSIVLGSILTNGATPGNIVIAAAQPTPNGSSTIQYATNGVGSTNLIAGTTATGWVNVAGTLNAGVGAICIKTLGEITISNAPGSLNAQYVVMEAQKVQNFGSVNLTGGALSALAINNSFIPSADLVVSGPGTWLINGGSMSVSATGNLSLGGALAAQDLDMNGGSFLAVAGGNVDIFSANGHGMKTNGGTLSMIAGAVYTFDSQTPNLFTVDGGNTVGGSINIANTPLSTFGGDAELVAFAGSQSGSGRVSLGGNSLLSTDASPLAGDIRILAGANNVAAIQVGNLSAMGPNRGAITLTAEMPVAAVGGVDYSYGAPTSAGSYTGDSSLSQGGVSLGAVASPLLAGSSITVNTIHFFLNGGNLSASSGVSIVSGTTAPVYVAAGSSTANITATAVPISMNVAGDLNLSGPFQMNGITLLQSGGRITLLGNLTTNGSNVYAQSTGNISLGGVIDASGGNVALIVSGTGGIGQTIAGSTLVANQLTLTTATGPIGFVSNPLITSANTVAVTSSGNVNISNNLAAVSVSGSVGSGNIVSAGSLTTGAITASGPLSLMAATNLTTGGSISNAPGTLGSLTLYGTNITTNAPILMANDVSMFASNSVTINANITAGSPAFSTTNMSPILVTQSGGIFIQSTGTGLGSGVTVGTGVQLASSGHNIELRSASTIAGPGGTVTMFAQGGNVLLNSIQNITFFDLDITAVAQLSTISPLGYVGGGIGIYSGPSGNPALAVNTMQWNRQAPPPLPALQGTRYIDPLTMANNAVVATVSNGGAIWVEGSNTLGTLIADGNVIWIDPVNLGTGSQLQAFGPLLFAPQAQGPAAGGQSGAATPVVNVPPLPIVGDIVAADAANGTGSGTILSVDATPPGNVVLGPLFGQPAQPGPATIDLGGDAGPVNGAPAASGAVAGAVTDNKSSGRPENRAAAGPHNGANQTSDWNVPQTQYIVVSPCQQYLIQDRDAYGTLSSTVVASAGTMLSAPSSSEKGEASSRTLALKTGKMVVIAGQKQGMRVRVSNGIVTLPPQSVSIIEQRPSGTTRVALVSGEGSAKLNIDNEQNAQGIEASAGEEIVLGDDAQDEEFIPADGVDRQVVSANIFIAAKGASDAVMYGTATGSISNVRLAQHKLRAQKNKFSQEQMNRQEKLLSPCSNDRQYAKETASRDSSTSHLRPIAGIVEQLHESSARNASGGVAVTTIRTGTGVIKHTNNADVSMEAGDTVNVRSGELLLWTHKPTVVKSGKSMVRVDEDTMVLVHAKPHALAVRCIVDSHANSLRLGVEKFAVDLTPGQEGLVVHDSVTPVTVLKADGVARRSVRNFEASRSDSVVVSEVSFLSLLQTSPLLRSIAKSTDPVDQSIHGKIMKTAVALSVVTGRKGPYAHLKD